MNNQWRLVALDDYREWVSYDANGNIRSYDRNGTTTAYGTPVAGHALEMDRLSYGYTEVSLNGRQVLASNRLRHVKDQVSDANRYTEDIDNQADDNYSYDAIGNLVRDQQGGNEEIRWTVYGKIAGIHKTDGTQVYYSYDASGNRISKTVDRSGSTNPSAGVTTTWYVRDAQGNVLSTYEKRGSSPLEQTELHLYGSSRLGIQRTGGLVVEGSLVSLYTYSTETLVRGRKLYELSNHLGNVLATITDKKVLVSDGGSVGGTGGICANGGLVEVLDVYNRDGALSSYRARQEINFYSAFESGSSDEWEGYIDAGATLCDNNGGGGTGSSMPAGSYYVADLVSATDYAPFGMGLVGRTYNSGAYKYAFNSKERDQDIGEDNYDYGMRIHDARLGRFLSVDPITKKYPELTPYQFASNRPIDGVDLDGLEFLRALTNWAADKAKASGSPRLSGFIRSFGGLDAGAEVFEAGSNLIHGRGQAVANQLYGYTNVGMVHGLFGLGKAAVQGDKEAQGQVIGMVVQALVPEAIRKVSPVNKALVESAAALPETLSESENGNVTYYRVQGGVPPKASKNLVSVDADGNVKFKNATLNLSVGNLDHVKHFQKLRPNSNLISFEVPSWFNSMVEEFSIKQENYSTNPANQGGLAPKIVDPSTPGLSLEFPPTWSQWLNEVVIPKSGKKIGNN